MDDTDPTPRPFEPQIHDDSMHDASPWIPASGTATGWHSAYTAPTPPIEPPPTTAPPVSPPRRARRGVAAIVGVALLASTAGVAGGYVAADRANTSTPAAASATIERASLDLAGQTLDVAGVVAAVEPSVVSVNTTIEEQSGPYLRTGEGAGTGIVLDKAGHIITNAHVVANATSITITVAGETKARTATVVGTDTAADIAVLQVSDATGLVPAQFASDAPQVGDQVVAIGNALALEGGMTVTEGIVSALDRTIQTDSSSSLSGLIQTDAAISSGNSGGPLVDATGKVVGINAAVAASGNGVEASNIGFAISIDKALSTAASILGSNG